MFNLGVEGVMLVGAVSGFIAAVQTRDLSLAVAAAMAAAAALAPRLAVLTITVGTDQAVAGLTLTLFGAGLSSFLGKPYIGIPSPVTFHAVAAPGLARLPVLGPVLFQQDLLVYASYLLVPLAWVGLAHTRPGLSLRAAGEDATADALGLNVAALRYAGAMAGVAGAYLSLAYTPAWTDNMTSGQGWIAIALVIFATWNPLRAAAGAYLFRRRGGPGVSDPGGGRRGAELGAPDAAVPVRPGGAPAGDDALPAPRCAGSLGRPCFREERHG